MKKLFIATLVLFLTSSIAFAKNYESQKYYKLTERNSKGQKVSTTRVYYQGDKSNVKRVETYSTTGRKIKEYR